MGNETILVTNHVFGALTRPAMIGGVTFEYYGFNLITSICLFIICSNLLYGLIFIPLHIFGWLVCHQDSHFFTIIYKKIFLLPGMPNQAIWKVRAYEPF